MTTAIVALIAYAVGVYFGAKAKEHMLRDLANDIRQKRECLYAESLKVKDLNNKVVSNLADLYREYDAIQGIDHGGEFTDRDAWLAMMWMD